MDQSVMIKNDQAFDESLEKIMQCIAEKKYFKARDVLLKHKEPDIAELFEELLSEPDILESTIVIYRLLPKDVSVEVFSYLPHRRLTHHNLPKSSSISPTLPNNTDTRQFHHAQILQATYFAHTAKVP